MKLRTYQARALNSVRESYGRGVNRVLLSMATGTGKTIVFAHLPLIWRELGNPTTKMLVLAHREELLHQARDKIQKVLPGARVGIEQGKNVADDAADIVVASVQSLCRPNRLQRYRCEEFGIVVVDEAHHCVAENSTYRAILDHFNVLNDATKLLVGVTATTRRGDNVGLEHFFQDIVFHYGIREAIRDGWLVPLRGYQVHTGIDIDSVRRRAGDFATGELSRAVNLHERNAVAVAAWKRAASDRRTLVFCVDVAHCFAMRDAFRENGVAAEVVVGETDPKERAQLLQEYREGRIPVLVNCVVLTEGYDDPETDCILLARPTQSELLYAQMVGRGTRRCEGKKDCLIIDLVDNSSRHSLCTLPALFGLKPQFDLRGRSVTEVAAEVEKVKEKYPFLPAHEAASIEELQVMLHKIDLFRAALEVPAAAATSKFRWVSVPAGIMLPLTNRRRILVTENMLGLWEAVLYCSEKDFTRRWITRNERLFASASVEAVIKFAESWMRLNAPDSIPFLLRDARWTREPASERQKEILRQRGVPIPENLSKGDASMMLSVIFAE